jgi:hypothetical protein
VVSVKRHGSVVSCVCICMCLTHGENFVLERQQLKFLHEAMLNNLLGYFIKHDYQHS